jgi:error-prone DNA polymerase
MPDARDPSGPPSRNFIGSGSPYRKRGFARVPASRPAPRVRYAELRAASAFSFLNGASLPEDLLERAAALELPAVALVDTNGVSGAPRFYKAARQAGVKALVGAEVVLDPASPRAGLGPLGIVPPPLPPGTPPPRLTLLVASRAGYKNLCKLLTAAAAGKPKGQAATTWEKVTAHADGLHVLAGGDESPLARGLSSGGLDAARRELDRLAAIFPGRLHVELSRHHLRAEEHRNQALVEIARSLRLPLVATNGVRYARREDKDLFDALSCIRLHTHLDAAGAALHPNRERHMKTATEMGRLFHDLPEALDASADLAERLDFTLADLGYRFPAYPLPPGETPSSYLRRITWDGARSRFRPLTKKAQAQLQKELDLIEKLDLAGYFLIVWDIVEFCRKERILVQGRGSAANSAVCYALSITAVDPVKMELLFERFLSEERGEWPDIDLDLPSGDQREKVIQHVYRTYGAHGAAMTANVITYRDRSAAREMAKAVGFSPEQVDRLAKRLGSFSFGEYRETPGPPVEQAQPRRGEPPVLPPAFAEEMRAAGFDPADVRIRHFARLFLKVQNLPRHLGQHSGGMVVAMGRLDEVVPLEPAAMPGRVVIQWDKDDCADLGIVKVDLLGLGMLGALEQMIPMIEAHEGVRVDLAHLPQDDPAVYAMLNEADTVGCFQVESRAQMASLPRHAPKVFYDIVVQVAIIRPGPIVGGMVHPFFDRRRGRAPVTYAHPSLEPILERTLGVPLFQEQLLKIAMVAASFTGGEAEELRRAMGFKRSVERMGAIEERLRAGMTRNGIDAAAQEQIVKSITAFALYGFPESHAASFALIAYASCWLKAHHPAAFFAALLNGWPMGFYHPATLVKDAQRHGTGVLPIDVNLSGWKCCLERGKVNISLAVRLGMRFIKGLKQATGEAIEAERARGGPFADTADLVRRCRLRPDATQVLAFAGALSSLDLSRREALWQVAEAARPAGPLYESLPLSALNSPLPEMSPLQETEADYESTELTAGPHLLAHMRAALAARSILPAADLARRAEGERVKTAGAVIVRQRPGTAKGFVFLSLEDETGIVQAIIRPDLFRANRALIVGSPGLVVEGRLQKSDGTLSVKAEKFWTLASVSGPPSHDFH